MNVKIVFTRFLFFDKNCPFSRSLCLVSPEVVAINSSVGAVRGGRIVLTCLIQAYPPPTLDWSRGRGMRAVHFQNINIFLIFLFIFFLGELEGSIEIIELRYIYTKEVFYVFKSFVLWWKFSKFYLDFSFKKISFTFFLFTSLFYIFVVMTWWNQDLKLILSPTNHMVIRYKLFYNNIQLYPQRGRRPKTPAICSPLNPRRFCIYILIVNYKKYSDQWYRHWTIVN